MITCKCCGDEFRFSFIQRWGLWFCDEECADDWYENHPQE